MLRLDIAEQFDDLRSISPQVEQYCATEACKETFGAYGDYSINDVLQECYLLIMDEMAECGIYFNGNYSDLLGDWYTAHHIYLVRYLTDMQYLQPWLESHPDDLLALRSMLDNPAPSQDILVDFFTYLADRHPLDAQLSEIPYILDRVRSNTDFRKYLRDVIFLVDRSTQDAFDDDDAYQVRLYTEKVRTSRKYVTEAVEWLVSRLPEYHITMSHPTIKRGLRDYDMDKISPDQIRIYSSIDLNDDINPYLQSYKDKMMDIHHQRVPHHIEYWVTHQRHPDVADIFLLMAHHADHPCTADDLRRDVNDMVRPYAEFLNSTPAKLPDGTSIPVKTVVVKCLEALVNKVEKFDEGDSGRFEE